MAESEFRQGIVKRRIKRHGLMPFLCDIWKEGGVCMGCGRQLKVAVKRPKEPKDSKVRAKGEKRLRGAGNAK